MTEPTKCTVLTISVPAEYADVMERVMKEVAEMYGGTVLPSHIEFHGRETKTVTVGDREFWVPTDFDEDNPEHMALLEAINQ